MGPLHLWLNLPQNTIEDFICPLCGLLHIHIHPLTSAEGSDTVYTAR